LPFSAEAKASAEKGKEKDCYLGKKVWEIGVILSGYPNQLI